MIHIVEGDCLQVVPAEEYDLIYLDPPFNTGKTQKRGTLSYPDKHRDYLGFMETVLFSLSNRLSAHGSIFVHLDYRAVHYVKVAMDLIFGEKNFQNEIIWAYDYGARSKKRWPTKHDSILWYTNDHKNYTFNYEEMDRIPYMAPGLVGKEKAAKGKTPTDVWWHTLVGTNSKEKTGYPTQKPLGILERIVKIHSNPGDLLLDPFAGSGSFGEAAKKHGRDCVLVDINPQAIEVMKRRLKCQN